MIGKIFGHYEIQSLLGTGGMGEVFQARDTKLGRTVAIKVLPEAFAENGERIARFEREAKLLASLNHPNIAALYGMEISDGRHFLVMELVEGETLADRLRRGAIPVDESLHIARQIAEALEAAHERGIVHRDLKPANIKITPDDKVKVLDFGLAKAMQDAPETATLSNSPTLSLAATQAGVILGTAAYMSPEQAKGMQADPRSDIFSFGCVLYEMLTGRQAFQGETAAEVLASVLIRDPDFKLVPTDINPRVHELLRRCLEKNPKRRWQAVGDLRAELESIAASPRMATAGVQTSQPLWRRAIPMAITAIIFVIIGGIADRTLKRPVPAAVTRFSQVLPEGQFLSRNRPVVAISEDGSRIAYISNGQVFVRAMSETEGRAIPAAGAPNSPVTNPFFSPDAQWIGFWSITDSTLKKIAVTGGTAIKLCKTEDLPMGVIWYDDQIVFSQPQGIMRVSANGGEAEMIVRSSASEWAYAPQILDSGRYLLFSLTPRSGSGADRWDDGQIILQSLRSGERKVVFQGGRFAYYVPTGHLVYAVGATLMAIPFNLESGKIRGGPTPLLGTPICCLNQTTPIAQFAFSTNGTLVYIPGPSSSSNVPQRLLAFIDRAGKVEPLPLPPLPYLHPRMSPDGTQLAFVTDDGKDAIIWIYDLKRGGPPRRLTFEGRSLYPVWTPDGVSIAYQSERDGNRGLLMQRADGSGTPERITPASQGITHTPGSWTPDGKTLVFSATATSADSGIWTVSLEGERKPKRLIEGSSSVRFSNPSFAPNGHWLAYTSSLGNGPPQLFVQPFPLTGAKFQAPSSIGGNTAWSRDGKQLLYDVGATGGIVAVDIRTTPGGTISFGEPVPFAFPGFVNLSAASRNYDITSDGKQFVYVRDAANPEDRSGARPPGQINIVLNWFEELKNRVPVR